jgi:hypothetical protein
MGQWSWARDPSALPFVNVPSQSVAVRAGFVADVSGEADHEAEPGVVFKAAGPDMVEGGLGPVTALYSLPSGPDHLIAKKEFLSHPLVMMAVCLADAHASSRCGPPPEWS